jgi:hypothetical protein
MRHIIWLMAAGLCVLSACSLTTPVPNQGSTPTVIATIAPEQPTPANTASGEMQIPPAPNQASPQPPSIPGNAHVTQEPNQAAGQPIAEYPYKLQTGAPAALQNFLNSDGCNYLGVGGQVFKLNGQAVTGLVVEITGTLSGNNVLFLGLTGNSQNLGPGGYEIKIGNQPVDSRGTLKIQLFDLNGTPQTPLIPLNTVADCNKNFILVNFSERYPIKTLILLPVMRR